MKSCILIVLAITGIHSSIFSRHLHRAGQWIRTAAGHLSLPYDNPAARGEAEGDAGHVRKLPQGVYGAVQVKWW